MADLRRYRVLVLLLAAAAHARYFHPSSFYFVAEGFVRFGSFVYGFKLAAAFF